MPTKREYYDRFQKTLNQKAELSNQQKDTYERIRAEIPNGVDASAWIFSQRKEIQEQKEAITPEHTKQRENALKITEEKRTNLIKETQDKINELEITSREKERRGEIFYEEFRETDRYQNSLRALQQYQVGNSAMFSMGDVEWSLSLNDHLPYKKVNDQMRALNDRDKDLTSYELTQKLLDANRKSIEEEIKGFQTDLADKKTAFDSLNGWQKFWARVLPASWYRKAQDYADIKNQEQAMTEAGIPTEQAPVNGVVENNVVQPEVQPQGEPLPEDQLLDLQLKTDLNGPVQEKLNKKEFEDLQADVELNESTEEIDNGNIKN